VKRRGGPAPEVLHAAKREAGHRRGQKERLPPAEEKPLVCRNPLGNEEDVQLGAEICQPDPRMKSFNPLGNEEVFSDEDGNPVGAQSLTR
jgi:hypothetical protein